MTLGEMVETLDHEVFYDKWAKRYDFCSYRGWYDRLCLTELSGEQPVADLVADLKDQIGRVHEGYKGGEYLMHEGTLMHIAEPDETGDQIYGVTITAHDIRFARRAPMP